GVEGIVAEELLRSRIRARQRLAQARSVRIGIDADARARRNACRIRDAREHGIIAFQYGALERTLQLGEIVHAAREQAAIRRARSSSASSTGSSGMLSSRSIIVDTGPQR